MATKLDVGPTRMPDELPARKVVTAKYIREEHEKALCGYGSWEVRLAAYDRQQSAQNASENFGGGSIEALLEKMFQAIANSRNAR